MEFDFILVYTHRTKPWVALIYMVFHMILRLRLPLCGFGPRVCSALYSTIARPLELFWPWVVVWQECNSDSQIFVKGLLCFNHLFQATVMILLTSLRLIYHTKKAQHHGGQSSMQGLAFLIRGFMARFVYWKYTRHTPSLSVFVIFRQITIVDQFRKYLGISLASWFFELFFSSWFSELVSRVAFPSCFSELIFWCPQKINSGNQFAKSTREINSGNQLGKYIASWFWELFRLVELISICGLGVPA